MVPLTIPVSNVEVGMICYNDVEYVERALGSLVVAGFDRFTVLDMGSTDGTFEIAQRVIGATGQILQYPRPSLWSLGYATARNVCASFCRREWLLFVDSDEVLTSGIQDGRIQFASTGTNPNVFAIIRHNLAHPASGQGPPVVASVEAQTRIYRPKLDIRWSGFIHEEINVGQARAFPVAGHSALKFDHYARLKADTDKIGKAQLYSAMLAKVYYQKSAREGVNEYWFDDFVRNNLPQVRREALAFCSANSVDEADFGLNEAPFDQLPAEDNVVLSRDVSHESILELDGIRRIHIVNVDASTTAAWAEWDHPGEGSRQLASFIKDGYDRRWDRLLAPEDVVIDIGAHSGDTAIPMAVCARGSGAARPVIFAFEPNPAVFPILRFNLRSNLQLADFRLVRAAVTDVDRDSVELTDHGNALCNGGIVQGMSAETTERLVAVATQSFSAPGLSLAAIFKQIEQDLPNRRISFIKIDCEGYDKEILRPCRSLLESHKPIIQVEWFEWFEASDSEDLFSVIGDIGYVPLDPFTAKKADSGTKVHDLLCVPDSEVGRIQALFETPS